MAPNPEQLERLWKKLMEAEQDPNKRAPGGIYVYDFGTRTLKAGVEIAEEETVNKSPNWLTSLATAIIS